MLPTCTAGLYLATGLGAGGRVRCNSWMRFSGFDCMGWLLRGWRVAVGPGRCLCYPPAGRWSRSGAKKVANYKGRKGPKGHRGHREDDIGVLSLLSTVSFVSFRSFVV